MNTTFTTMKSGLQSAKYGFTSLHFYNCPKVIKYYNRCKWLKILYVPPAGRREKKKFKSKVGSGMNKELNRTMHQWRGYGGDFWVCWRKKKNFKIMLSKKWLLDWLYLYVRYDWCGLNIKYRSSLPVMWTSLEFYVCLLWITIHPIKWDNEPKERN